MLNDAELLRRYAEDGLESAFAELVQRHVAMVYGSAVRQLNGDAHSAEDVVQVVFSNLAKRAAALVDHPSLAGWLFVSARHASAKIIRSRQRRIAREYKSQSMEAQCYVPDAPADWSNLRPVLDEVIAELDAVDREAVLLRFFEQRPYAEIGSALQLSEDASRKRVDRALEKLGALLAQRNITSTAGALAVALATQSAIAVPASFAAAICRSALESAASGTPLVRLLQEISRLKSGAGLAAAGLVIVAGLLVYEVRAGREAERALLAADETLHVRLTTLAEAEGRLRAAEGVRNQPSPQVTAASVNDWDPVAEGQAFLREHPEVKQAMVEHSRAKTNFRFGPLYQSLGLTAFQIRQFQDLVRELQPGVRSAGIDGKELVLAEGDGRPAVEVDRQLRELLGASGYAAFRAAQQSVPARRTVFELAEALAFTDAPLTSEQSDQLIRLLNEHRLPRGNDWAAVAGQADIILSGQQHAAFDGIRAQGELAAALGFVRREAFPGPSGTYMPANLKP